MHHRLILLTLLLTTCCFAQAQTSATSKKDSLALEKMMRSFYRWNEKENSYLDFVPLETEDSLYHNLDPIILSKRLEELRSSGFFTERFIDAYNELHLAIDGELVLGDLEWYKGEMSPYDTGASPWCNCQDVPNEKYWKTLTVQDIVIDGTTATFTWSWGYNFKYQVIAKNVGKSWKIYQLEGFNF